MDGGRVQMSGHLARSSKGVLSRKFRGNLLPYALKRCLLVGMLGAALSACSVAEFEQQTPLTLSELAKKSWQPAVFLEQDVYSPATYALSTAPRTLNGFDIAVAGDRAHLALSLYDASTERFEGFVRTYRDGTGWLTGSPGFQRVATSASASIYGFGAPWIAANEGGRMVAGFWNATDDSTQSLAVSRRANRWGQAALSTLLEGVTACHVGYGTSSGGVLELDATLGFGNGTSAYYSSEGRVYLFYASEQTGNLKLEVIEPAATVDNSVDFSTLGSISDGGGNLFRHVESVADGNGLLCFLFEGASSLGTRSVQSRCLDLTEGGGFSISPDPDMPEDPDLVSDDVTKGFAVASDEAGTLVTLQYESTTDGYEPTYSVFRDSVWDSLAGLVDSVNADLDTPADSTLYSEARPAITHLRDQYFIGVWVRIDPSTGEEQVLTSVYSLDSDTWSTAIALVERVYENRPSIENLTLISNHGGDVVLAVRFVATEDTTVTGVTAADSAQDLRRTLAFRYQAELGWLSGQSLGQGCTPKVTGLPADASRIGECTLPAKAVLLPSGNALVVFQDQDASGRTRPAAAEFR